MMKCYLVARFDATASPPTLIGMGLHSESWHTMTLPHTDKRFYADLAVGEGDDYVKAQTALFELVDAYPGLKWVRGWLMKHGGLDAR
jgi:hypothetical protein